MLALTEPVIFGLGTFKSDWFVFDRELDVGVSPITEWLILTPSARTPKVDTALLAAILERLFVVDVTWIGGIAGADGPQMRGLETPRGAVEEMSW